MRSLLLPLLLAAPAAAQFPGDVFFASPSVSVVAGSSVELEVQVFAGGSALGGVAFEVVFDATEVTLEAVLSGTTPGFTEELAVVALPDRTAIVVLNDLATDGPIGTSTTARLVMKPLVAAGTQVAVELVARSAVDGQSQPFAQTNGFTGSLQVVSSAPATLAATVAAPGPLEQAFSWSALGIPGQPRRLGHDLDVVRMVWLPGLVLPVPVAVRTIDPTAPVDR